MACNDNFYSFHKLSLTLTSACNLACKMCLIRRGPQDSLSRKHAVQAAEFAGRRGFKEIEVSGGEPTLVEYFWDVLDLLCDTGAEVKVVTNGYRLTDEHVRRFSSYPRLSIQVSIDGVGELHDSIRGVRGAFEASEKALLALVDSGCRVAANTVVQRSNFRHMVELYERFKNVPLMFHAFILVESGGIVTSELIPRENLEEFLAVISEIMSRADRDGNDVVLSDELLETYRRRIQYPYFLMHPGRGCTVVKRSLSINHQGYVLPCWHYLWETERIQRRLDQRSIDEIVDSPEVRDEICRIIGPGGCRGCSTMCYNWEEDFCRKVMRPTRLLKLRRACLCGKEYLRIHHPGVFKATKSIKRLLRI